MSRGVKQPMRSAVTFCLAVCVGYTCLLTSHGAEAGAEAINPDSTIFESPEGHKLTETNNQKPIHEILKEPENKEIVDNLNYEVLQGKEINNRRAKNPRFKGVRGKPIKIITPVPPVPAEMKKVRQNPPRVALPKNPALDFVENRRPRPVKESSKNGTLASEFNKLNRLTQRRHPAVDFKKGDLKIKWDNDMFFLKWGINHLADKVSMRRAPHTSTGVPWPLPQRFARNEHLVFRVDQSFKFIVPKETCDIVEQAIVRFRRIILEDSVEDLYDNLQNVQNSNLEDPRKKYSSDTYTQAPLLSEVEVVITKPCVKYPSLHMDESYTIEITERGNRIVANEVWGALKGLETFSQLIWRGSDGKLYLMETIILDQPRFPHRGVLIDTARHYIFKDVILDVLRGMEHNKMNVLHWHMTDDQSFPFQSEVFPEMSEKGAYHPTFVYTHEDVTEIVEFARLRGIRVIPEFDVPGHTYAWGHGNPDLIAKCYNPERPVPGLAGPIDPSRESTYIFLRELFKEILHLFPDEFVHGGGDEVPDECWRENNELMENGERLAESEKGLLSNLQGKMRNKQRSSFTTMDLWQYFENRFMREVEDIGKKRPQGVQFLLWQEAATRGGIKNTNNTIAEIWMGGSELMREAIHLGYRVLYSACWYLDMIKFGPDWPKYYNCDPAFPGQGVDETKVLGGEACLWGEYVDNENLMTRLWPRASAAAERLWSDRRVRDVDTAAPRMHEQRCRMLSRGLGVGTISGPDYCLRRGKGGGHAWRPNLSSGFRRQHRKTDMFKDSLLVLVQVLVVLLILGALMKSNFPLRMLNSVRQRRHSTILVSFLGLIGLAVIGYSGMWMYVTS